MGSGRRKPRGGEGFGKKFNRIPAREALFAGGHDIF